MAIMFQKAVPMSPAAAIFINCISHRIKGVFFANLSSFFAWKNGGENSILYIEVKILPFGGGSSICCDLKNFILIFTC